MAIVCAKLTVDGDTVAEVAVAQNLGSVADGDAESLSA